MGAAGGSFVFPEPFQVSQRKGVALKFKMQPCTVGGLEIKVLIHVPDLKANHFCWHDSRNALGNPQIFQKCAAEEGGRIFQGQVFCLLNAVRYGFGGRGAGARGLFLFLVFQDTPFRKTIWIFCRYNGSLIQRNRRKKRQRRIYEKHSSENVPETGENDRKKDKS